MTLDDKSRHYKVGTAPVDRDSSPRRGVRAVPRGERMR